MMVKLTYFKPSGKYYLDEETEIPEGTPPWCDLKAFVRIRNMHVFFPSKSPWGYPLLLTADRNTP